MNFFTAYIVVHFHCSYKISTYDFTLIETSFAELNEFHIFAMLQRLILTIDSVRAIQALMGHSLSLLATENQLRAWKWIFSLPPTTLTSQWRSMTRFSLLSSINPIRRRWWKPGPSLVPFISPASDPIANPARNVHADAHDHTTRHKSGSPRQCSPVVINHSLIVSSSGDDWTPRRADSGSIRLLLDACVRARRSPENRERAREEEGAPPPIDGIDHGEINRVTNRYLFPGRAPCVYIFRLPIINSFRELSRVSWLIVRS